MFKSEIKIKGHTFSIFWLPAFIGASVLLLSGALPLNQAVSALIKNTAVNPVKILVLFFSMSYLSFFLDELGFFRYLAAYTVNRNGSSQTKLFLGLYLTISLLTIFTSNDIIIFTFTPFICYFTKNMKINPIPYLIGEFVAANTWSMIFIIGNPTNIYLATSYGINFLPYLKIMWLPAVFGGIVSLAVLLLLFHKMLKKKADPIFCVEKIEDKPLLVIALLHLILCTVFLIIASYIGLEMWIISLCFAVSLFFVTAIYRFVKKQSLNKTLKTLGRLPYELIPFVIAMFVFVTAFEKTGLTEKAAILLSGKNTALVYGISSFAVSNIINNIPMSVLFCGIISNAAHGQTAAVYSSVIGSNIGAFLTPLGALAGIMWLKIIKKSDIKFSAGKFVFYGFIIAIPTLFASIAGLLIALK